MAFNSTGSLLASGSQDGLTHIYGLDRRARIAAHTPRRAGFPNRVPPQNEPTRNRDAKTVMCAFSTRYGAKLLADFQCPGKVAPRPSVPPASFLAALSEGTVSLFDPDHRRLLRTMPAGEAPFNLAFSKDGSRLAAAGGDFAFVWDVDSGRQLLKATHAASSETLITGRWIVDAAISPDGKFLAYAAKGDKLARVWNVETARQILELKHDSSVAAVAFNADGTRLGTGSYDGTARVWELPSGREIDRISHGGRCRGGSLQPRRRPLRR